MSDPTFSTTPATVSTTPPPNPSSRIILRTPNRYHQKSKPNQEAAKGEAEAQWQPPTPEWMERTWTVTHSTLPMWRKSKNVRITYKILPPKNEGGVIFLDDTVESEPVVKTLMPQPKKIRGIDTPDPNGVAAWNWRGKGWLRIASSHWEVLGWGERDLTTSTSTSTSTGTGADATDGGTGTEKERWVVTWFASSLFTPAGVDIYSDRKQGGSEGLVRDLLNALEGMECSEVSGLCEGEMRAVVIDDS